VAGRGSTGPAGAPQCEQRHAHECAPRHRKPITPVPIGPTAGA
jgi:hypothetical protein